MDRDNQEDTTTYEVVVNQEEQYSIWPEHKGDPPLGWKRVGQSGTKDECLVFIKKVWTDMRPLSLRKQMEELARRREEVDKGETSRANEAKPSQQRDPRDNLVKFLSEGDHPVEITLRPEKTVGLLREAIDRGYVLVKFTNTRGGTELGVRLDGDNTDLSQADFDKQRGKVHLVGGLTLNYAKVRCIADIDLQTLTGQGHLESVEA